MAKEKAGKKERNNPGDFKPGNQFWKFRTTHGSKKIFSDPDVLWEECQKYFQWCLDHPLMAAEVVKFQGIATLTDVPKMRAMTLAGLCFYLKISDDTWGNYRKDSDLVGVIREAEQIIYNQKFAGAAADLLNANIIARDLGLVDKKASSVDIGVGALTDKQIEAKLALLMKSLPPIEKDDLTTKKDN